MLRKKQDRRSRVYANRRAWPSSSSSSSSSSGLSLLASVLFTPKRGRTSVATPPTRPDYGKKIHPKVKERSWKLK